ADLGDIDLERRRRWPELMGDALLELGTPERHQSLDEPPRALGPIDPLRPIAALMPARDHQLEEIDDMVGMQMREQDRVEGRAAAAGGDQPLGGARAHVDQELPALVLDQARRSEAVGVALRTAGSEQRDPHGTPRPGYRQSSAGRGAG